MVHYFGSLTASETLFLFERSPGMAARGYPPHFVQVYYKIIATGNDDCQGIQTRTWEVQRSIVCVRANMRKDCEEKSNT